MPVRLLLMGLMGAGKTTVGQAVAEQAGWTYLDNDELVERATGETAKQILAEQGEPALRAAESAALRAAIALDPPVVAGVAGGAVLIPADRMILAAQRSVVWLRASHALLAERLASDTDRPWLAGDPAAAIERMAADREVGYAEVADLVVDVDGRTPQQIAEEILATFR